VTGPGARRSDAPPTELQRRGEKETRAAELAARFDRIAPERDRWRARNRYYYDTIEALARKQIPKGAAVLEIGCSTGDLLASLEPDRVRSLGVDVSPATVAEARKKHPGLRFEAAAAETLSFPEGTRFDWIVLSDVVGHLHDVYAALRNVHAACSPGTRLFVTYYNFLWEGVLSMAENAGLKMPQQHQNWLSRTDIENLLALADFSLEGEGVALLVPKRIPIVSAALNAIAPHVPGARHLCLVEWFVASAKPRAKADESLSVTVVIPCRNERGNIEAGARGVPDMGCHTEVIFVDGSSTDGTIEEIERMTRELQGVRDIKLIHQTPRASGEDPARMLKLGKGDAVRKGFRAASGDVVMILDADLTVPPEDLPKFFEPLAEGKADFVNGSRLTYSREEQSMRFVNLMGNKGFGLVFSWLLEQPVKDTLCGTKALRKKDYEKIEANRAYFGEFDPFGDFDLLFGAAKLGLRIVDMPVRYRARVSGVTKVRVMTHGWLLVGMSWVGFRKLKLKKWLGGGGARGSNTRG
jgi:SAM-dependent methyltransferase/glycosyltransferase involved in cell wall biosynthesis